MTVRLRLVYIEWSLSVRFRRGLHTRFQSILCVSPDSLPEADKSFMPARRDKKTYLGKELAEASAYRTTEDGVSKEVCVLPWRQHGQPAAGKQAAWSGCLRRWSSAQL